MADARSPPFPTFSISFLLRQISTKAGKAYSCLTDLAMHGKEV